MVDYDNVNSAFARMIKIFEHSVSEKVEKHISALREEMNLGGNDDFINVLVRKVIQKSIEEHFPVTPSVCDEDH